MQNKLFSTLLLAVTITSIGMLIQCDEQEEISTRERERLGQYYLYVHTFLIKKNKCENGNDFPSCKKAYLYANDVKKMEKLLATFLDDIEETIHAKIEQTTGQSVVKTEERKATDKELQDLASLLQGFFKSGFYAYYGNLLREKLSLYKDPFDQTRKAANEYRSRKFAQWITQIEEEADSPQSYMIKRHFDNKKDDGECLEQDSTPHTKAHHDDKKKEISFWQKLFGS